MVRGFLSKDSLSIGEHRITGQGFGEMTHAPGKTFVGTPFDGVLGLGYASLAKNGILPPFQNMLHQGILDEPLFSFYLGRGDNNGGELRFGSIDGKKHRNQLQWLPVQFQQYWEVALEEFKMGNFSRKGARAAIDTGTSLIICPNEAAETINKQIGAEPIFGGLYKVNCNDISKLPPVTFSFKSENGIATFTLPATDYILKAEGGECLSSFIGVDLFSSDAGQPELWVLGDSFLKAFYSVYDHGNHRIGLAEAI